MSSISLALLSVAAFVLLQCNAQPDTGIEGNEEEKELCEDYAKSIGRTLLKTIKDRAESCYVICFYTDGRQDQLKSPDGQTCCNMCEFELDGICTDGSCVVIGTEE